MKDKILKVELENIPTKRLPVRIKFHGKKMKLFTRSANVTFYEAVRKADKPFFVVSLMVKCKIKNKQNEDLYVEVLMRLKNEETQWTFTDFDIASEKFTKLFDQHG